VVGVGAVETFSLAYAFPNRHLSMTGMETSVVSIWLLCRSRCLLCHMVGIKHERWLPSYVIVAAKITEDDGTARDKVAHIKELETQRNRHVASGRARYEVVACIDGREFRERREDMRQMLLRLDGKVFTTVSLDQLVIHTRLKEFVTTAQHEQGSPKGL